jgi:hypothetical protein
MHGGTAEQMRWLLQAPPFAGTQASALDEALAGVVDGRDRLVRAVAHPEPNQRVLDSQALIRDLWRAGGGLGPYPLLDVLAEHHWSQVRNTGISAEVIEDWLHKGRAPAAARWA